MAKETPPPEEEQEFQRDQLGDFDTKMLDRIEGERISVGGHKPFFLDEKEAVWLVLDGELDIFAVEYKDGVVTGRRHHISHISPGEIAMGVSSVALDNGCELGLLAVAAMGTLLFKGHCRNVIGDEFDLVTVNWVDTWAQRLALAVYKFNPMHRAALAIEAEPGMEFKKNAVLTAQHHDVVWMEVLEGEIDFLGQESLRITPESEQMLVLTDHTYATVSSDAKVNGFYSPTALIKDCLWENLEKFYQTFMVLISKNLSATEESEQKFIEKRLDNQSTTFNEALTDLAKLLEDIPPPPRPKITKKEALLAACQTLGNELGIDFKQPRWFEETEAPLDALVRNSRLRYREISLGVGWPKWDLGPMLGYMKEDNRPVAIVTGRGPFANKTVAIDTVNGTEIEIDEDNVGILASHAHMIYRPLPEKVLKLMDVMRFGLRGMRRDYIVVFIMAIIMGAISLVTPIVTSELLAKAAPRADFSAFFSLLLALGSAIFGQTCFEIVRGFALLRVESRMEMHVQAAIWDRLLRLPVNFFRQYTAGDLADRANGFSIIRQTLTSSAISGILGSLVGVFNIGLMFWYSWRLALLGMVLIIFLAVITFIVVRFQMKHQRALFHLGGRIDGLVFQLLSGVSKLRVSHNEAPAIKRWSTEFTTQKKHILTVRHWSIALAVFNSFYSLLGTLLIFALIYYFLLAGGAQTDFDLVSFLPFNAAFGQAMGAALALTSAIAGIVIVVPLYERAQPIMEAEVEISEAKEDPGKLRGEIEFDNIGFSYVKDGPKILEDISFKIKPGEYVAFAGPSGSGKSTIYRLLLGFETPDSGAIYLDGHDLSALDLTSIRKQSGVVLQTSNLVAGSIMDNIIGTDLLTLDDAWEAARAAGLDEDIAEMPMQMHTVIPEGGGGISGGQKQRILIARALARKPRIILLDEATSALDNKTQAVVQNSLEKINVTRVVIAHRLSTIRNADRIYMLKDGRIVEQGKYDQLIQKEDGEFARFAKRQIV